MRAGSRSLEELSSRYFGSSPTHAEAATGLDLSSLSPEDCLEGVSKALASEQDRPAGDPGPSCHPEHSEGSGRRERPGIQDRSGHAGLPSPRSFAALRMTRRDLEPKTDLTRSLATLLKHPLSSTLSDCDLLGAPASCRPSYFVLVTRPAGCRRSQRNPSVGLHGNLTK